MIIKEFVGKKLVGSAAAVPPQCRRSGADCGRAGHGVRTGNGCIVRV